MVLVVGAFPVLRIEATAQQKQAYRKAEQSVSVFTPLLM
jgi:hypothetical protein